MKKLTALKIERLARLRALGKQSKNTGWLAKLPKLPEGTTTVAQPVRKVKRGK